MTGEPAAAYPDRMCGRYAAGAGADELVEELSVEADHTDGQAVPDFNMAPTKSAPVCLTRTPRGEDAPVRQLRMLTWGLVPSWAKDRSVGNRMINARAETLLEKPSYRRAATSRRCLVPALGYYEWQESPVATDTRGRPRKQPFFIHRRDGRPLVMAGLYEFWRDRTLPDDAPDAWLVTYTIVTTSADPDVARIHERQPLVLDPQHWNAWLDPDLREPDAVQGILDLHLPGRLDAYPVSTAVGSPRSSGPGLLDPAPADSLIGVVDPATGEVLG